MRVSPRGLLALSLASSPDCRCLSQDCARGLELDLDLSAMTIASSTSWDTGLFCPTTGSTDLTASGHALNTCGPQGTLLENDDSGGACGA